MYFHLPVALITEQFIMNDLSASWWVYGTVRPLNRIFCPGVWPLFISRWRILRSVFQFLVVFFLVQCTYSEETAFGFFCVFCFVFLDEDMQKPRLFRSIFSISASRSSFLILLFHLYSESFILFLFIFSLLYSCFSLAPSIPLSVSVSLSLSLSLSLTGFFYARNSFRKVQ